MHQRLIAAAAFALAACTSTSTSNPSLPAAATPAQVAAQLCPPVQVAIAGLQADAGLPQGALQDLAQAAPRIAGLCAAAATATSADVQSLENLAFLVVLPIAQQSDPRLAADLVAMQIVLAAVQAAQAGAAPVTPASAPVSAPTAAPAPATPAASAMPPAGTAPAIPVVNVITARPAAPPAPAIPVAPAETASPASVTVSPFGPVTPATSGDAVKGPSQ